MRIPTSSHVVPVALVLVMALVSGTSITASEESSSLSARVDVTRVTPAARAKLNGYLGDRHAANIVYLQYLHDAVPPWREIGKGQAPTDERVGRDWMLDAFRQRGQPRARDWQGEYAGKWIDAAAWTVGNTGDARLSADLDAMVQGLIASQTPDGYLGIDVPVHRGRAWDVWNIWYALTGLLSDYEACGHRESLEAARRGGEYLVDNYLPPEARYHIFRGAWQGGCTVDVLDQVVRLYGHTNQPGLLQLAVDAGDNPGLDLNELVLPDPLGTMASVTALGLRRRYEMNMLTDGKPQPVVLTPFAAVGNGDSSYRTTFPTRTESLSILHERDE